MDEADVALDRSWDMFAIDSGLKNVLRWRTHFPIRLALNARLVPLLMVCCLMFSLCFRPVAAHDWGGKAIVIVQGFSAGSGIDVVIRQLQEPLEQALGTRLVMEYRPGAGSNIASAHVAQAKPDGHPVARYGCVAWH